jgi:hypothetical protein
VQKQQFLGGHENRIEIEERKPYRRLSQVPGIEYCLRGSGKGTPPLLFTSFGKYANDDLKSFISLFANSSK